MRAGYAELIRGMAASTPIWPLLSGRSRREGTRFCSYTTRIARIACFQPSVYDSDPVKDGQKKRHKDYAEDGIGLEAMLVAFPKMRLRFGRRCRPRSSSYIPPVESFAQPEPWKLACMPGFQ